MGNLLLVLAVVVILAVNILFAFLRGLSNPASEVFAYWRVLSLRCA